MYEMGNALAPLLQLGEEFIHIVPGGKRGSIWDNEKEEEEVTEQNPDEKTGPVS